MIKQLYKKIYIKSVTKNGWTLRGQSYMYSNDSDVETYKQEKIKHINYNNNSIMKHMHVFPWE